MGFVSLNLLSSVTHFQAQPLRETGPEERGQGRLQTHVRPACVCASSNIFVQKEEKGLVCVCVCVGGGVMGTERICEMRAEKKRVKERRGCGSVFKCWLIL